MVCDAVGRIDVWQTEGMRKLMTEETDTIDVVFAVFGICRRIVQLVVDAVSAYCFPSYTPSPPTVPDFGQRQSPELPEMLSE